MINNLIWMGFLFLSGATIPLATFPGWLQRVALFIPAEYLATGLESAGARMATGYQVLEDSAALALGLAVAFEVSRQLFRWEPEAKVPRKAKLWVLAALVPFLLFGTWESVTGRQLHHINQNFQELSGRLAPSQTTEPR